MPRSLRAPGSLINLWILYHRWFFCNWRGRTKQRVIATWNLIHNIWPLLLFIDNFVVRWMELVSNNYILGDSSELNSAIISRIYFRTPTQIPHGRFPDVSVWWPFNFKGNRNVVVDTFNYSIIPIQSDAIIPIILGHNKTTQQQQHLRDLWVWVCSQTDIEIKLSSCCVAVWTDQSIHWTVRLFVGNCSIKRRVDFPQCPSSPFNRSSTQRTHCLRRCDVHPT